MSKEQALAYVKSNAVFNGTAKAWDHCSLEELTKQIAIHLKNLGNNDYIP